MSSVHSPAIPRPSSGASVVTPSRAVFVLGVTAAVLAAVAAAAGLLLGGGPGPHAVTSVRGQATDLYSDDRVRVVLDDRLGDFLPALVARPVIHQRAHETRLLASRPSVVFPPATLVVVPRGH